MITNQEKFNFFVPTTFTKGTKNGQEVVRVKGIASTSSAVDSDGETLFPSGFDLQPLLMRGYLNWDHNTKLRPSAIVGEPDVAEIRNNGKDLYIEGFLYPGSKEAQEIAELAEVLESNSSTRRLGYSIEGQVLERGSNNKKDPKYKQVLRARITGVAITPCPKNPNTILSLIKGEYNDLYVDGGEEVEKAMSAEGMGAEGVIPEHIEGTKNPNKIPLDDKEVCSKCKKKMGKDGCPSCIGNVGQLVRKSEIYNLIASNYTTDVAKAKAIYSLIEKSANMQNGEITMDAVNKAFDLLNKAAETDINKGESTDITNVEDPKKDDDDTDKKEDADKDKKAPEEIEKGADLTTDEKTNGGDISKDIEKAIEMGSECIKKGMNKGEAIDALVKGGFELTVATGAVDSVINAMSTLKENGGTVAGVTPTTETGTSTLSNISKAEIEDLFKEVFGETNELVKGLSDNMGNKFDAVGKILKATMSQNELLKGVVDELQKSQTELTGRLHNVEQTAAPLKSMTSVSHVERFQKSEAGQSNVPSGFQAYSIGSREGREDLLNRLDAEIQKSRNNGLPPSALLERTVAEIEICKSIPQEAIPMLQALSIAITK
jgi:hypothetical protein